MGRVLGRRSFFGTLAALGTTVCGFVLFGWRSRRSQEDSIARLVDEIGESDDVRGLGLAYLHRHPDQADVDILRAALAPSLGQPALFFGSDPPETALRDAIANDFGAGRTVELDGWVFSQTELRLSALAASSAPGFLGHGLRENPMSKEVGEMVRSRDVVQAEGSARTEGARRATGVRADGAAAGAGSLAPGQRWSASRKRDVVLRLLRGESLEALSREAGVEIYRLEAWRARAMAGLELGLKDRHGEPVAEVLDAAKRHIGELSMEIELLRERVRAAEQRLPLAMRRSRR